MHCRVGEWKVITNFTLSPAYGLYRHTNHVYKMDFGSQTTITDSDNLCDNMFLELHDFANITNGSHDTSLLIGMFYLYAIIYTYVRTRIKLTFYIYRCDW